MKHLILLLLILFSLGNAARISLLDQQVNGYGYEIAALMLLLILIGKYRLRPIRESVSKFKIVYAFLFYLLVFFAFGFNGFKSRENLIAFLYLVRLFFYFFFFFYLIFHLRSKAESKKVIKNALLIFLALTTVFSLLQYFFYPDLRNLLYAGWDPHLYRLFGVFFDTSISGAIFGLIFFVLIISKK